MTEMSVKLTAVGSDSPSIPKGARVQSKCSCRRAEHDNREALARGLKVIRVRFSIPDGELPFLEAGDLSRYLTPLQNPGRQPRPSTPFPRRQVSFDSDFPVLLRLGRRERWELALSVASLKRGLRPTNCPSHPLPSKKDEWFARACPSSPPPATPEYLSFVRKVVRKEFRLGWDSSYESFTQSFIPKDSSRMEKGISSALDAWRSNRSYEDWQRTLRSKPAAPLRWDLRYKEVPTVGKVRAMGIPTTAWDFLAPLHKSMYQYMSSKDWLMRGSPTPSRIKRMARGMTSFTSVDLVAATDGLKVDVAEAILGVVLSKASHVPGFIRQAAAESLRPSCEGRELTFGQNMGTYLSFPLLCLQSYCAARWATRGRDCRILVNGDDTIIFGLSFVSGDDYPEGFQLNDSKTVRSNRMVELNSTVFLKTGRGWEEVRNLRRGAGYLGVQGVIHLASVCKDAGQRWIDALARSRLLRKWSPSQLGLDEISSPTVWSWSQTWTKHGGHTVADQTKLDQRFELSHSEPSEGDRYAFRKDLFEGGRGSVGKRTPREGPKFRGTKNAKFWSLLTPVPWNREVKLRPRRQVNGRVYLYSSNYCQVEDYWQALNEKADLDSWLA
jgi:hypothetical protein